MYNINNNCSILNIKAINSLELDKCEAELLQMIFAGARNIRNPLLKGDLNAE